MSLGGVDSRTANRILLALPRPDLEQLWSHLEPVDLLYGQVIYRDQEPVTHLYFVDRGLISRVKTMEDGKTVEIGVIGIEGVSGCYTLFGMNIAILVSIVQIPGSAFRIQREVLRH